MEMNFPLLHFRMVSIWFCIFHYYQKFATIQSNHTKINFPLLLFRTVSVWFCILHYSTNSSDHTDKPYNNEFSTTAFPYGFHTVLHFPLQTTLHNSQPPDYSFLLSAIRYNLYILMVAKNLPHHIQDLDIFLKTSLLLFCRDHHYQGRN